MTRLLVLVIAAAAANPASGQTTPSPSIPHDIEGYIVTRQENNCLECHDKPRNIGKKPAKGQPKPAPATHYASLESKPAIGGDHYICTSCHARK